MPSFNARFIPNDAVRNGHRREHCSAQRGQLSTIGVHKGQQVRLERDAPDGLDPLDLALYTVIDVHDEEPDAVFVGYRDTESTHHDLRNRLGLSSTDPFTGKINSEVPHPAFTDDAAAANGEFVERITDNGRHKGLIAIAPHGGPIEQHTDEQAERVGKQLSSKCVSVWVSKGFKQGGGAFDRWHITSTDISEESFPKLKSVIGHPFEYAVAFHGWGHDSICIGGSAPPDLKQQIKTAVASAITGSEIAVAIDDDGTCHQDFNGNDPKNIVNHLGTNGIQIEQLEESRARFGIQIAETVATVIGPKIKVCTAPVFEGSSIATRKFRVMNVVVHYGHMGGGYISYSMCRDTSAWTCLLSEYRLRHTGGIADPAGLDIFHLMRNPAPPVPHSELPQGKYRSLYRTVMESYGGAPRRN